MTESVRAWRKCYKWKDTVSFGPEFNTKIHYTPYSRVPPEDEPVGSKHVVPALTTIRILSDVLMVLVVLTNSSWLLVAQLL
jgi:hypothetical protein